MQRLSWRLLSGYAGSVLVTAALVTWWVAEASLEPPPDVKTSPRGMISSWGCREGVTGCELPDLAPETKMVIALTALIGCALLVAALVSKYRWDRANPPEN
ncbi:hypothetical protein [Saccharomonospora iraqiensis]|uniref:hypothetical protein n=1 Tax=Saccharomonospora iraqiensis TaxID=52698 RepID=UPI00041CF756|nr:hypothetical protein [Saccharomonospora iraqiensis]